MTRRAARAGASLVELLVVVAIIGILAALLLNYYGGSGGSGSVADRTKAPVGRAKGVACQNNLSQIRMALQMAAQTEEGAPVDLSAARRYGVTEEMLRCPESGQPYRYDPAARMVRCPTPGHEQLAMPVQGGG